MRNFVLRIYILQCKLRSWCGNTWWTQSKNLQTGIWGKAPSGIQEQSLRSRFSWTPFCIITTWGVGQFVL